MAEESADAKATARPAATSPPEQPSGSSERAGDFERYALIAALTLVVLCLLIWDNWQGGARPAPAPRTDRTLRVQMGGDAPRPGTTPPRGDAPRVTVDTPPPPAPPAPPPAPSLRTYTVKSGDTLGDIAKRELGSSARAGDIAELNGISDPAKIKQGQVLRLPAK